MPLVAYSELPAFESLRREGVAVTTPEQAAQSDLAALRIGLLNLMPDASPRIPKPRHGLAGAASRG